MIFFTRPIALESYVDLVDIEDCKSQSFPFLLSLLAANEQKNQRGSDQEKLLKLRPTAPPCVAAAANREQR
jgi:hypothetical protein